MRGEVDELGRGFNVFRVLRRIFRGNVTAKVDFQILPPRVARYGVIASEAWRSSERRAPDVPRIAASPFGLLAMRGMPRSDALAAVS
jgi:hypothetical protein